ncbi:FYDLN acid domain-containing protein [Oceanicella sp. SM1341]|uniref:FYDLN acid domain-containing protein n=1 Tax=Oceanicella sp. SM1341 TaxID=1548889 RepID=UPI000E54DD87|nr:FYDLN acid domain-containing protein [Oceanicella sp. SM1341]
MPNPEWGVKRVCPSCAARFYDLTNDPATCPVCGGSFSLESLTLKRGRAERAEAAKPAAAAAAASSDDMVDDVLDDDDDDIDVADDDVLDDDDDDDTVSIEEIGERGDSDDDSEN